MASSVQKQKPKKKAKEILRARYKTFPNASLSFQLTTSGGRGRLAGLAASPRPGCCFAPGIREADNGPRFMDPIVPGAACPGMCSPCPPGRARHLTGRRQWAHALADALKMGPGGPPAGRGRPQRPAGALEREGRPGRSPGEGLYLDIFSATVFSGTVVRMLL